LKCGRAVFQFPASADLLKRPGGLKGWLGSEVRDRALKTVSVPLDLFGIS
jgi:hypothetical protein